MTLRCGAGLPTASLASRFRREQSDRMQLEKYWWLLRAHHDSALAMTVSKMPIDRRKAAIFAAAAVLRLAVFLVFPNIADLLTGQVEVSTPVSSFKRRTSSSILLTHLTNKVLVQEGLFLYKRNVSPYDGGVFHQVLSSLRLASSGRLTVRTYRHPYSYQSSPYSLTRYPKRWQTALSTL